MSKSHKDATSEDIKEMFKELRSLYKTHKSQIEDEITYLTDGLLHKNEDECASACRAGEYLVYGVGQDVISDYLEKNDGEITDLGAEAIVRRLTNPTVCELANFNGWLHLFGFKELEKK